MKICLELVCNVKPDQVTLVPDIIDALTSNAGWDTISNRSFLKEVIPLNLKTIILEPQFSLIQIINLLKVQKMLEPIELNYIQNHMLLILKKTI